MFRTTEGVKQGGVLSPYLFNFFMNELLESTLKLEVGACLGLHNVSILAYCDDIILISPLKSHMNILIEQCTEYADNWKLQFNPLKSNIYCSDYVNNEKFYMSGMEIPKTEGFVYLGLPIGNKKYISEFFSNKMKRVERAFYSLRGLGCKIAGLSPEKISFIYKQYCQSIIKFGFENLFLNSSKLRELNVRQNILVKSGLGLNYYCRTKPLFHALKIEQLTQLYLKHKLFFLRQIYLNRLTRDVFGFLDGFYHYFKSDQIPKETFTSQLLEVEKFISEEVSIMNYKKMVDDINNKFRFNDTELNNEIKKCIDEYKIDEFYKMTKKLNFLLKY